MTFPIADPITGLKQYNVFLPNGRWFVLYTRTGADRAYVYGDRYRTRPKYQSRRAAAHLLWHSRRAAQRVDRFAHRSLLSDQDRAAGSFECSGVPL